MRSHPSRWGRVRLGSLTSETAILRARLTSEWTSTVLASIHEEIKMTVRMIHRQIGFASLACALWLGGSLLAQAQDQNSTTTKDQTTTTTTTQSSDSSAWQAPRGYELAYPENGSPNMV